MIKSELRNIYLAKQKNFSPIERKNRSKQIANCFIQAFDLSQVNFLHCFLPIEKFNEIDTKEIFQRIWREFAHLKTVVPRVNFQTHEIENVKFTAETKLVKNAWGINEPTESEVVETEKIDVCLVPLLCFDARGFRVGYGKGFYDKFLKNCRADCLKIGLGYFAPVAEISDAENFDVKIDFCVTPVKIVNCK
jgi:5-formyltetrahydrofolate cyclo-ligase